MPLYVAYMFNMYTRTSLVIRRHVIIDAKWIGVGSVSYGYSQSNMINMLKYIFKYLPIISIPCKGAGWINEKNTPKTILAMNMEYAADTV